MRNGKKEERRKEGKEEYGMQLIMYANERLGKNVGMTIGIWKKRILSKLIDSFIMLTEMDDVGLTMLDEWMMLDDVR